MTLIESLRMEADSCAAGANEGSELQREGFRLLGTKLRMAADLLARFERGLRHISELDASFYESAADEAFAMRGIARAALAGDRLYGTSVLTGDPDSPMKVELPGPVPHEDETQ